MTGLLCSRMIPHFHPAIADLIWASDLGTFSHKVQCVGAFIYLKYDIKNTHQPSVHWLIAHNIPIWYQWDEDEVKWAKPLQSPIFGYLWGSANPLGSSATRGKKITRREYFERCEESCPHLLNMETTLECERCLNREWHPCHGPQSTIAGLISEGWEILTLHYGMVLPDLNKVELRDVLVKEKRFWLQWIGACEQRKLASVVSHFWQIAWGQFFYWIHTSISHWAANLM